MENQEPKPPKPEITMLLKKWAEGDSIAGDRLFELIYSDLKKMVGRRLINEGKLLDLQTKEIIHETYLRLVDQRNPWENRMHFFAMAAEVIRRVIMDHVRKNLRQKRGGDVEVLPLSIHCDPGLITPDWLALDEAMTALEKSQPLGVKICKLRYFAGLTVEETALLLDMGTATVDRHWRLARAILKEHLGEKNGDSP